MRRSISESVSVEAAIAASNAAAQRLFDPAFVRDSARRFEHIRTQDEPLVRAHGWRILGLERHVAGDFEAAARAFMRAEKEAGDGRGFFATGAIDCHARLGSLGRVRRLGARLWSSMQEPALKLRLAAAMVNASTFFDDHVLGRVWVRRGSVLLSGEISDEVRGPYLNSFAAHELYFRNAQRAKALALEALSFFPEESPYARSLIEFNVAQAELLLGNLDVALSEFLRLRDQLARGDRARLEELLGDLFLRLQMPDSALEAYRQASVLHRRYRQPHNVANCQMGMGQASLLTGDRRNAKRWFRRAERAFSKLENPVSELVSAVGAARCEPSSKARRQLEQLDAKTRHQARGIAHLELTRALLQFAPSTATIQSHRRLAKAVGLNALDWDSHYAEAKLTKNPRRAFGKMFEAIERERMLRRSTESQLRLLADRQSAVADYLAFLLSEEDFETLREVLGRARSVALLDEMVASTGLSKEAQNALDELRAEWTVAQAEGPARRSDRKPISAQWMRRWSEVSHTLVEKRIQKPSGPPKEVAVQFQAGPDYVFLDREKSHRVPVAELEAILRWWSFELAAPMLDRDAPAESALAELQRLKHLLPNLQATVILPETIGWSVPWSLLWDREVHGDFLPDPPQAQPEFDEENVAIWYHAPPDLPLIEQEVEMVRQRFPQARVLRTVDEVRSSCDTAWKWIHVACHADFREENPMFSALHLQDGPLWAAEVARLPLRGERVVLSACDTGRLGTRLRYEPQGWVRAFRACGAREILATQWPLDDEAGFLFFRAFYEALPSYNKVREAVAAARKSVRERYPHPYFWGAPTLFGRGES
jgi:hypothetical protein